MGHLPPRRAQATRSAGLAKAEFRRAIKDSVLVVYKSTKPT
jgi:hypothetical protein